MHLSYLHMTVGNTQAKYNQLSLQISCKLHNKNIVMQHALHIHKLTKSQAAHKIYNHRRHKKSKREE